MLLALGGTHTGLLDCGINYICKKFYATSPWGPLSLNALSEKANSDKLITRPCPIKPDG